jgi:predicted dehydrogenase
MEPLGIGIVGTGNIAGGYARDILTHPEIHLVATTDLDPARSHAFAQEQAAVRTRPSRICWATPPSMSWST